MVLERDVRLDEGGAVMTASQKTREMRGKKGRRVYCPGCGARCNDYTNLRKHQRVDHNEVI